IERSLYYYFLMCEVTDAGVQNWRFIAKCFGVKAKDVKYFEGLLSNPVLAELATVGDVEMHKNYLDSFCRDREEFGCDEVEREILNVKGLALHKIAETFSTMQVKSKRLIALSHKHGQDHAAAVLYALSVLMLNPDAESKSVAENILYKELVNCHNSDAGIVLLRVSANPEQIMSELASAPDMLLHPDEIKLLSRQYGKCTAVKSRHTIGF
ncbi:MAG: hypothetical protein K2N14_01180, partial [Clostridia bacterium]|nr:hypothetical protein [Clostridia bacterium]